MGVYTYRLVPMKTLAYIRTFSAHLKVVKHTTNHYINFTIVLIIKQH